jgi:hypothetical protein
LLKLAGVSRFVGETKQARSGEAGSVLWEKPNKQEMGEARSVFLLVQSGLYANATFFSFLFFFLCFLFIENICIKLFILNFSPKIRESFQKPLCIELSIISLN